MWTAAWFWEHEHDYKGVNLKWLNHRQVP